MRGGAVFKTLFFFQTFFWLPRIFVFEHTSRGSMQHDFEGAEAVLYVRNGIVVRRLKKAAAARTLRMKPRDALLSLCHANLVRILEISPDGDMHMECMQTSLQRHIRAGQRCSAAAKLWTRTVSCFACASRSSASAADFDSDCSSSFFCTFARARSRLT
jgi:hypothetical protein